MSGTSEEYTNLALGQTTEQSGTWDAADSNKAVDGDRNGDFELVHSYICEAFRINKLYKHELIGSAMD